MWCNYDKPISNGDIQQKDRLKEGDDKMKKLIVILSVFSVLLCGFGFSLTASTACATAVSPNGREFEGQWVVSNYQEGEALTLKYDETVVRISKNGGIFLLDGPTTSEIGTRYRLSGNNLIGVFKPDFKELKERYPTAPDRALLEAVASGKVVYNIKLTMGEDSRIFVELDNLELFWLRTDSTVHFHHIKRHPGYWKYALTTKV